MNEQLSLHQTRLNTTTAPAPRFTRRLIAGAVVLALASGGIVMAQSDPSGDTPDTATRVIQPTALPSFADVAERVSPAVVNVSVTSDLARQAAGQPALPDDVPAPEFFRRFFDNPGHAMPHRINGQGSGFILDSAGHIVTNHHVIDGASEIKVVLNDGSSHPARVVGRDAKTDLALLKIDVDHPLPHVELGDASRARVGDWVLAVGNPFGLGGSVNAGIISARGRDINAGPYDDYLQIDAAINQGNSGGPLFDTSGQVIGVNTAIYSPSGGNVGIGFAIPADTVQRVVADLRQKGHVERGWLGLQIQAVTPELAAGLGLKQPTGVLVADVVPAGPAAQTDLQAGDLILSANGHQIDDHRDLPKLVADTPAGSRMTLEILRDGQPRQVSVTIGRMPDEDRVAATAADGESLDEPARLGLYLTPLTPQTRLERGLEPGRSGVLVSQVEPGSAAARAGIEAGSLISMVGADPVDSPAQVLAALRKATAEKREALILRVEKDGQALFVAVPLAA